MQFTVYMTDKISYATYIFVENIYARWMSYIYCTVSTICIQFITVLYILYLHRYVCKHIRDSSGQKCPFQLE